MHGPVQISRSETQIESEHKTDGFFQSFISHPASVGESYLSHLFFALRFAVRLMMAGCAALVHAFIPAWFETTASRQIQKMHDDMLNRHSKPHCE